MENNKSEVENNKIETKEWTKLTKTKMGFLETLIKPIGKVMEQKSEKIQVIDIRNKRGSIIASQASQQILKGIIK